MIPLKDENPTSITPVVTILFIIANVLVFVGWQLQVGLEESVRAAALVPERAAKSVDYETIRTLFASMFMHGGWMHLIGNMWFLWIFGNNIEDEAGHFKFAVFYLVCGVAAAIAHVLSDPTSTVPIIGASGAVSGVLGAYLVLHPKSRVLTLIPIFYFIRIIYVPAYFFLGFWIVIQIISNATDQLAGQTGGVAYLAHIAGFFAGLVLIFLFKKRT